jgi:carboxyl-terminal processing protease
MLRALFVSLALVGFQVVSFAQAPSPAATLVTRAMQLLQTNYFGFKPIDFDRLEDEAERRVGAACGTRGDCGYDVGSSVLDEVLAELGDGHTFRMSANRLAQFNADGRNARLPMIGLKFDALPDAPALVVTRVRAGSSADRAGLKRGDVVWGVNGERLERFKNAGDATAFITDLELNSAAVTLNVSGPQNLERRDVTLLPEALTPWVPTLELRADGIAVITFYQFLTSGQIASRVHDFVRQAQRANARGIILDVRGSGGGSSFESIASAGAFTEPVGVRFESKFGSGFTEYQNGAITNTNFQILNPAKWAGPVLVLTNRLSRSAAEYMTFFLQNAKRARVLGEATAGVLNTSTSVLPIPGGGAIAVTSGRSSTLEGTPHPERVAPDIVITDDMSALSRGRDVALERALQWFGQP